MIRSFSFNNTSVEPVDSVADVANAITAMAKMFEAGDHLQINDREASGIYNILRGLQETLDAVEKALLESRRDPWSIGFLGEQAPEFRRGFHAGLGYLKKRHVTTDAAIADMMAILYPEAYETGDASTETAEALSGADQAEGVAP